MSSNKDSHTTGKYAILAALIGAAALFGNTYYKYSLGLDTKEKSPKIESTTTPIEQLDNAEKEQLQLVLQEKIRLARQQEQYLQLIQEAEKYFEKDNYVEALSAYHKAKGKIIDDYLAKNGITKVELKLYETQEAIKKNNSNSITFIDKRDGHTY